MSSRKCTAASGIGFRGRDFVDEHSRASMLSESDRAKVLLIVDGTIACSGAVYAARFERLLCLWSTSMLIRHRPLAQVQR
jgi:hypothetical protein